MGASPRFYCCLFLPHRNPGEFHFAPCTPNRTKGSWVYNDMGSFSENIPEKTSILTRVNKTQSSAYGFPCLVSGRSFCAPASHSSCSTVCSFSSPHVGSARGAAAHISAAMGPLVLPLRALPWVSRPRGCWGPPVPGRLAKTE